MEQYRLRDPMKLQALIEEYGRLRRGRELSPQRRGERLNHFLSELFGCWGIEAAPSVQGTGEIDLAFELGGRDFVLEAKWEKARVEFGAIATLQRRVQQRLGGTIGLFLSMSGFTPDAVRDLKDGQQLSVLLLSIDHFEAMLSGFVAPPEMIGRLVRRASTYGDGFTPLRALLESAGSTAPNLNFDAAGDAVGRVLDLPDRDLIITSAPSFEADIIASKLPPDVLGIVVHSDGRLLFTLPQGIYALNLRKRILDPLIRMPDCSGSAVVTEDGGLLVARNHGVGRLEPDGSFRIVGGGFVGNFRAVEGEQSEVWVLSDGHRMTPMEWGLAASELHDSMVITKLGEALGDERRHTISPGSNTVTDAMFIGDDRFFIFGHLMGHAAGKVGLDGTVEAVWLGHNLPRAVARLAGTTFVVASDGVEELAELDATGNIITASHGVEIALLNVATHQATRLAQLNVRGTGLQLVACSNAAGYLYTIYPIAGGENAGALISWRYPHLGEHGPRQPRRNGEQPNEGHK
jgi:hypothetical protein